MQRILFLTTPMDVFCGGYSTAGHELYEHLKCKCSVNLITHCNLTIRSSLFKQLFSFCKDYRWITREFKQGEYDCIICSVELFFFFAVLLKKILRIKKLILIGYGTNIYYPFINSRLNRFLAEHAVDLIIVPSRYTYNKVREWYQGGLCIVKLGVNLKRFYRVEGIQKEKAFISVGHPKERKGGDYLMQAFSRLAIEFPDVKLYVVARKSKRNKELIEKYGLVNNIIFTGHISHAELLTYYSRCLCHVLPSVNGSSSFEGFGLVHLEANACGIPTIGSSGTANEDAIVNNQTGFLCPEKNIDCLYNKMKLIIGNKDLYNRLCDGALKYAQNNSWDTVSNKIIDLIEGYSGPQELDRGA